MPSAAMLDPPRPTAQTLKNCRRFISIVVLLIRERERRGKPRRSLNNPSQYAAIGKSPAFRSAWFPVEVAAPSSTPRCRAANGGAIAPISLWVPVGAAHGRDAFRGHGPLLQIFVQIKFLFIKQRVIYCLMRVAGRPVGRNSASAVNSPRPGVVAR